MSLKEAAGKCICFLLTILDFFVKLIFKDGEKYRMYNSSRDMK